MKYNTIDKIISYTRNLTLLTCLAYSVNSCSQNKLTTEEIKFNKEYEAIVQLENKAQETENLWKELDTGYRTTTEQFSVDYHMIRTIHSELDDRRISMEKSPLMKSYHNKGKKTFQGFLFWMIGSVAIVGVSSYGKKLNNKYNNK